MLAGAAIFYRLDTNNCGTIVNRAEFAAAADAGKASSYLHFILQELGTAIITSKSFYEDNNGARLD
jgi:hypothetical protein